MKPRTSSSSLLISEPPLQALPSLAKEIGLEEAIFLQQVHYWLGATKHHHDERFWIYNTYEEWHEQMPFVSIRKLKRIVKKLEELNLIIKGNFNKMKFDKTNWYTINYETLNTIEAKILVQKNKMVHASCQFGTTQGDSLAQPIPREYQENKNIRANELAPQISNEENQEQKPKLIPPDEIVSSDFDDWWEAYPKKRGKKEAYTLYKSKAKKHSKEILMNGLLGYVEEGKREGREERYTKMAKTFLRNDNFLEYQQTAAPSHTQQVAYQEPKKLGHTEITEDDDNWINTNAKTTTRSNGLEQY